MNVPQKIKILRFVAEQGVATVEDIQKSLPGNLSLNSIRVTLYHLGLAHTKFGHIPHGVWYVDNQKLLHQLKTYFPSLPDMQVRKVHLYLIPHTLGMNSIRIILENTPEINIVEWWSERHLQALQNGRRMGFSLHRMPDALFWRKRSDGTRQMFFVEYERTLKSPSRYRDLFQFYANRDDVLKRNVLYICENDILRSELEKIERSLVSAGKLESAGLYFQFITLEDFFARYSSNNRKTEEEKCVKLSN